MSSLENSLTEEEPYLDLIFKLNTRIGSAEESDSDLTPIVSLPSVENKKKLLCDKALYSPGSGDICNKYIAASDSTVFRHVYYNYPSVNDPGIEEALFAPEQPTIFADDGQELYLQLCSKMNLIPVRMFYRNLLNTEMNLSYYGVNPKAVSAMATALQYNTIVTRLDLTDNFLNNDACYHLGQMLESNTTLKELILSGCRIGASGLQRLGEPLASKNKALISLNLTRNELGDKGGVYFAKIISDGARVQNVVMSKNGLARATALALMEAMEWRDSIVKLDLSWSYFIDIPSTTKMLKQMGNSTILQDLNLSFNSFESQRVANAIFDILGIPTLQVLDLSHNRFQGEAINTIIAGLIKAKSLITFNLSFNPMSPEDAYQTLLTMLNPHVKLQNLSMENISVNKSFLELLSRVSRMKSRKNFSITYGDVLHNWIVTGPDPRELLLKRAKYIGISRDNPKDQVDVPLYFLRLNKEMKRPVAMKLLLERLDNDNINLGEDFVNHLAIVFGGSKAKLKTIDLSLICEYVDRLWPEKRSLLISESIAEPDIQAKPVLVEQLKATEREKKK